MIRQTSSSIISCNSNVLTEESRGARPCAPTQPRLLDKSLREARKSCELPLYDTYFR